MDTEPGSDSSGRLNTSVSSRAAAYSFSESASTDRSLASRFATSGSRPGLSAPWLNERWYLIGPGMRTTRKAISFGLSCCGSLPK